MSSIVTSGLLHLGIVMAGGALGAGARFLVVGVPGLSGGRFPFGILIVNLVGCFVIGLVLHVHEQRGAQDDALRFFLVVGFLGSLTTFSTFGYDTLMLLRSGDHWLAAANVLLNVVLGVLLVALGWQAGKWTLAS